MGVRNTIGAVLANFRAFIHTIKVAAIVRFFRRHWEPVTAICALLVSAASAVVTYQGISLTHDGIRVSQESLHEARRSAALQRVPIISMIGAGDDASLYIANVGPGPAAIYQVSLSYEGRRTTLDARNSLSEQIDEINDFMKYVVNDLGLSRSGVSFDINTPIRVIKADQGIMLFHSKPDEVIKYPALIDVFDNLGVRICYMDVIGEHWGEASFDTTDLVQVDQCGPKPAPLLREVYP